MELLLVVSDVVLISIASILGLIYYNYRAQQKAFSEPSQGPKAPAWLFQLQNAFNLCSWVTALVFGILCSIGTNQFNYARITLCTTILFAEWTLLCNAAIIEGTGARKLWSFAAVVATLLSTTSITLVSVSHHSSPVERAARYFPPSAVSITEVVVVFRMGLIICRAATSTSAKVFLTGTLLSWRIANLALLWSWTILLGRRSTRVVMIIQFAQVFLLVLPLRYSPMAILRYKRQVDKRQRSVRLEVTGDDENKLDRASTISGFN